ncbi:MAG: FAD-dependent oxidoreductase, partial [Acidobacteriota bacterium]
MARADRTIVVVGAGIAGLLLASALKARGESVVVLEKSRGLGGRLATKRVGDAVFDQGAQYFTARQAPFRALVAAWRTRGAVTNWPAAGADRFIGTPSMNAMGRLLAEGLDVRRESHVGSVRREGGYWRLAIDHQPAMRAGRLLLTAPVPQSLALLRSGGVPLPDRLLLDLQALTYHPCVALLVTLDGPSAVPVEGLELHAGPVRWLADNTKKGISVGVASAVTVHLQAAFSAAHYGDTEAELVRLVLPGIEQWLGAPVL